MNRVMDSNEILICFFPKLFFVNYIITKINNHKIKHQSNIEMLKKIKNAKLARPAKKVNQPNP
jgi:hypothetical protein